MISQTLIEELKKILREEYCLDLSDDEVADLGKMLTNYFDVLLKMKETNNEDA